MHQFADMIFISVSFFFLEICLPIEEYWSELLQMAIKLNSSNSLMGDLHTRLWKVHHGKYEFINLKICSAFAAHSLRAFKYFRL